MTLWFYFKDWHWCRRGKKEKNQRWNSWHRWSWNETFCLSSERAVAVGSADEEAEDGPFLLAARRGVHGQSFGGLQSLSVHGIWGETKWPCGWYFGRTEAVFQVNYISIVQDIFLDICNESGVLLMNKTQVVLVAHLKTIMFAKRFKWNSSRSFILDIITLSWGLLKVLIYSQKETQCAVFFCIISVSVLIAVLGRVCF